MTEEEIKAVLDKHNIAYSIFENRLGRMLDVTIPLGNDVSNSQFYSVDNFVKEWKEAVEAFSPTDWIYDNFSGEHGFNPADETPEDYASRLLEIMQAVLNDLNTDDAYSADNYHAVLNQIETDSGLEWEASYPSIPGVVGGGKTKEEALADAEDNLQAHLEFLKKDGVEPPKVEE